MPTRVVIAWFAAIALLVAACGGTSPEEHLARGTVYFDEKKYQEAVLELRSALQIDPQFGPARLKLGDTYTALGEQPGARAEYVRAADLLPDNMEAQLKAGNALLLARQFEDAQARAQRAIEIDPKNLEAQMLRGNALAGLKKFDEAISDFSAALALDPTQTIAYENLGILQMVSGDLKEAEATFRRAVEVAPKSVDAHLALANFLWTTRRQAETEATLNAVIALEPANLVANRALGMFYLASGRPKEAEELFGQIARTGTTPGAKLALADYYLATGRNEETRKALTALLSQPDVASAASLRLATLEFKEGLVAQASGRLTGLLDKDPRNTSALLLRARLNLREGRRDQATADAKAVLAIESTGQAAATAHEIIGQVLAISDKVDDAIVQYELAQKLVPQPLSATLALARLHFARRQLDKSTAYAQQALAIRPGNAEAQTLLIRSFLTSGDLARAKRELQPLNKAFPTSPTVLSLNARVFLAEKRPDLARAAYERALQLVPGDYEALAGIVGLDLASGRAKEASARIDRYLATQKPSVEFMLLAGRTYAAAGQTERAEKMLGDAIAADPSRLQAYAVLGQMAVAQGHMKEAEGRFRAVLKNDPSAIGAGTMVGLLLEAQNKPAEAEQEYRRVLGVNPRAAVAANNLAWMYLTSGRNLDEAADLARTAQQGLPDDPDVNDTLGWILFKKGDASGAVTYLEKSVAANPDDAGYHYHLGLAYVELGQWERAKPALTRALGSQPKHPEAEAARKALSMIGG